MMGIVQILLLNVYMRQDLVKMILGNVINGLLVLLIMGTQLPQLGHKLELFMII